MQWIPSENQKESEFYPIVCSVRVRIFFKENNKTQVLAVFGDKVIPSEKKKKQTAWKPESNLFGPET